MNKPNRCQKREPWSGAQCCLYEAHEGDHKLNQRYPPLESITFHSPVILNGQEIPAGTTVTVEARQP